MRQLLFKWGIGLYLLMGAYNLSAQVVTEANQADKKIIEDTLDEVIQAFNDGEYDGKMTETLIELSDQAFEITVARLEKQRMLQPTAPYWAHPNRPPARLCVPQPRGDLYARKRVGTCGGGLSEGNRIGDRSG